MSLVLADIQEAAYATSALTAASHVFGFYVYPRGARLRMRGAVPQFMHLHSFMLQWSSFHYRITTLEGLVVLNNFILVFFKVFCDLNILLLIVNSYLIS